jgi:two-component system cell cycle response regulator
VTRGHASHNRLMEQPKGAGKRVLIVDDSRFVRTTFNRILSAAFAVHEEADGEAGWQALQADTSIGMLFTDLDMPKLDGFGLIARVRSSGDARLAKLPVVVISGNENESAKKRALDIGANDFISKTADAPEILARIDNLLRLHSAKDELQQTKQSLELSATHDALTGTLTKHYLVTEGQKRFSYARRHGTQLSVLALRIDSHAEVIQAVSKDVADQILARVAKLITGMLRTEDSIGRIGDASFVVISAGTGAPQVLAFARRLREQLEAAKVSYGGRVLRMRVSAGVASLGTDTVGTIEDLIRLGIHRLDTAVAPAAALAAAAESRPKLPAEIEAALQVLERLDAVKLDQLADDIARRLAPIVQAALKLRQSGKDKLAKLVNGGPR